MKNALLLILFAPLFVFGQKAQIDLPINWEDTANVNYNVTDFGDNLGTAVSVIAQDPTNPGNLVLQTLKPSVAPVWAGTTLSDTSAAGAKLGLASAIPFSAGNTIMQVRVYSPDAGTPVLLKVEDKTDPTKFVETTDTTTVANAWEILTFDFTNPRPNGLGLNFTTSYNMVSIFHNFLLTPTGNKTFYVDDVVFGSIGVTKSQIDLPITWNDTANVDYTVTDFGGNASMLAADPTNASNIVLQSDKTAGAQVWAGTTLGNGTPEGLASAIPFVSGSTIMKVLVYSPDAGIPVLLKVEDKTNAGIFVETTDTTTVANAWDTLVFDFSNPRPNAQGLNFASTYDKVSIFYNFGTDGATAGAKTYFCDVVWFDAGTPPPPKAQIDLPITWNDTANVDYTVTDFGGNASMLAADPTNASNIVLQSDKTAGAQVWAGTTLGNGTPEGLASAIPFVSGSTIMKVLVYSPDAGIPVLLKVEDKTNAGIFVETTDTTTVANAWDTLVFDFSNPRPNAQGLNFASTYDKVSIFYNFGTDGATAGAKTYFCDVVWFDAGTPPPPKAQIDLPITWNDTANVDYTVTDFGGNASMLAADPTNASNIVLQSDKTAGAQVWAGTTLGNGTPEGLASAIPFVSGSTIMKVLVYSPDAGIPVLLKVEDKTNAGIFVETTDTTTVANAWDTLVFDFSNPRPNAQGLNFASTYDKVSIFYNFGTDGATAGAKTYFCDVVWFDAGTPPPPKAQIDLPITWNDTANVDYTVTDFGGNASMLAADPTNASNIVLQSDKTAGAQVWAGTTLGNGTPEGLASAIPFVSGSTIMKVLVYSPDAGIPVLLKVEDKTNAGIFVETTDTTTVANAWDTLVFDFSNPRPNAQGLNFASTYDKVSIFYNFGTDGATAGAKTYFCDVVWFDAGTPPPPKAQIDLPITWNDTANVDYTVTDFGGNASMLAADPTNASNIVLQSDKTAGAQVWAGTTLGNGTPEGLASAIPFVSGSTIMKVLVYSPDAGIPVLLKVEDKTNAGIFVETTDTTTVANAWDTLVFDFSNPRPNAQGLNFASTYDKVSIFYNFGTDGATAGAKTYFCDVVWFDAGTPPPPKAQIDLPITWNDTANVDYTVTDFGGNASVLTPDPVNSLNIVLQSIKTGAAQTWAGTTLSTALGLANPIPFDTGQTTIRVLVYSPDAGIPVRLKAEDATNAGIFVETEELTTVANAWDTIEFDFTNNVPSTPIINFANTYDKLSIFYNFGTDGATAGQKTYYCDLIEFDSSGGPIPQTYNITFQVDMNQYTGTFTTPEVNGDFNGWCGNCAPMSDTNGDNIWELTIPITADSMEFKFSYDNWAGQEILIPGSSCTKTNGSFTNRFLILTQDTVLPAYCYGSCATCAGTPSTKNVTFRIDMSQYTGTFTTPEVNGDFNSWCGNCAPMSDLDGDNIWELTIPIAQDSIEFKFSHDNWTGQETLMSGMVCTKTDTSGSFTNRFTLLAGDTILPAYCWESCSECVTALVEGKSIEDLEIFPNPSSGMFRIKGMLDIEEEVEITITDSRGVIIYEQKSKTRRIQESIDLDSFNDGIYLLTISTQKESVTRRLVVLR